MLNHHTLSDRFPVKRLDQVADFLDNLRKPVKASDRVDGDYAYYGANGQQGTIDDYIFDERLVLLAEDGGNFDNPKRPIAYIAEGKYWVNNHAHVLKPKSDADLRYLFWCLAFYNVMPFIKGATRAKLNKSDASRIPIPLPPLEEQRRIVEILDAAQGLIDQRKEQLALMDQLVQSLFYDMFGDPVTNPMGWDEYELQKLCSKIGSGATPRGGKQAYKREGISLIRSLNIHDIEFRYKNLAFIGDDQAYKLKNVVVEKNDVLFNITGASVCRCAVVPKDILPARVNQHVAILRPIKDALSYLYLVHLLTSKSCKRTLLEIGSKGGATREAITKEELASFMIPVPPIALQTEFAERVGKIETQKAAMTASLSELEDTFNALMQRAFKGELGNVQ